MLLDSIILFHVDDRPHYIWPILACPRQNSRYFDILGKHTIVNNYTTNIEARKYVDDIRNAWLKLTGISADQNNYAIYNSNALNNLYFEEAILGIHKYQNPRDCKNSQFLISGQYRSGSGSELHVETMGLAIAMSMVRIYILAIRQETDWRFPKEICNGSYSYKVLNCYYQAWSNCEINIPEIIDAINSSSHQRLRDMELHKDDKTGLLEPSRTIEIYRNDKFVVFPINSFFDEHKAIPPQMISFIDRLPIFKSNKYYLWRAIDTAYLTRPTEITSRLIEQHAIKRIDSLQGQCVSMYVRHGDK